MKQKIYLLTLAFCILILCGCNESEPQPTADTPPPVPSTVASIVSTQPSEKETVCAAEVTGPQVPVTTDETVPSETATEATTEQAETSTAVKETIPAESRSAETQPQVTEPPETEATKPEPTVPPTTEPPVTTQPTTEPELTEPVPTETVPEETESTEPPAETIDTAALESYGRSYASGTYGYNGTSACHPGTGAGYFPAATKEITSMEDGRSYVRQAIDSQYKRDLAYGYTPYEEIDGQIVRCPINVSVTSTGDNTYAITVYYGGTA